MGLKINITSKEKSYKKNLIKLEVPINNDKVVFIILTKVIVFYIRPDIINFKKPKLEKHFSDSFSLYLSLKNCLYNLLKVFFYILNNIIYKSLERSSKKSN